MVMVHLDARKSGVCVPVNHATNPALALNLSLRFNIPDFTIDEHGVSASLSFDRTPFPCVLPWTAIFAVRSHVDESFFVWPEDVPAELVEHARAQLEALSVDDELGDEKMGDKALGADDGEPTPVPYLRVVK